MYNTNITILASLGLSCSLCSLEAADAQLHTENDLGNSKVPQLNLPLAIDNVVRAQRTSNIQSRNEINYTGGIFIVARGVVVGVEDSRGQRFCAPPHPDSDAREHSNMAAALRFSTHFWSRQSCYQSEFVIVCPVTPGSVSPSSRAEDRIRQKNCRSNAGPMFA